MPEKIRDVMTAPPRKVPPQATLQEAAAIMREEGIGDLIVAEGDTLLGLLTDRDIVIRCVADGRDVTRDTVESAHSGRLAVTEPDTDIEEAAHLMREHSVRRLPVMEGDQVVGVVSIGDMALQRDPRSALADISTSTPNT